MCDDPKTITVKLDSKGRFDEKGKEKAIDKFSVGALTGFQMAMDALEAADATFGGFRRHDIVKIECVGTVKGENGQSDMPEFTIMIDRR